MVQKIITNDLIFAIKENFEYILKKVPYRTLKISLVITYCDLG